MEPILITDLAHDGAELLVHAWRAEQLRRLGLSRISAEMFAELVDRHEIAVLVARGYSPDLAIEIARECAAVTCGVARSAS